jgi:sulfite reductase (NADPH) hemoprotein beta-component
MSAATTSVEERRSTKLGDMAKQQKLSDAALTSTFNKLFESVTGQSAGGLGGGGGAAAKPPKLTILFGSDGGNAEAVAKRLASEAKEQVPPVPVTVLPGNDFDLASLKGMAESAGKGDDRHLVLGVVGTAGQGEFPGNMHSFWDALGALDKGSVGGDLSGVSFAVCGLGDRNYWPRPEDAHLFCKAGKDLDAKFESLGMTRVCDIGLGDDQDDDGYETGVDAFAPRLWAAIAAMSSGGAALPPPPKKEKKKKMTVEDIKIESNFLRGTIAEGLADESTGAIHPNDTQLTKFHGIYQQDDRDLRMQLQKEKKEKAYSFLIRIGPPGGIVSCQQWMVMQDLADEFGFKPLKITTRQAVQYHGVLKKVLKKTMQGINKALLTSLAACGDVNRNVMCNPNPLQSVHHAAAQQLALDLTKGLLPRTTAYHEIWLDKKPVVGYKDVEPLYGPTYLPRKFKIAIAIPPSNDVDVFAHCLGFIAVIDKSKNELLGWNVSVGGGLGMTHNKKGTFPRLADIMGFVTTDQCVDVAKAVVMVQRDHGDRTDRKHARLKYTIDDHGLGWFKEKVEEILGWQLPTAREYAEPFTTNVDRYGWTKGLGDTWHYGLYVENGRVKDGYENHPDIRMRTGLMAIAKMHKGDFRLTPNQHIIVGNVSAADKPAIDALLREHGMDNRQSGMRGSSIACTALPTCCHALAEAERYLPQLITSLEDALEANGLREDEIVIRMTGCPNGCGRPYLGEIGLVGRAPGIYNVYLGAKHTGERLNKLWKESLNNDQIVSELSPIIARYAAERTGRKEDGSLEHFGDFCVRIGVIKAQSSNPKIALDEGLKRTGGVTFHEHTPIWDW